MLSTKLLRKRNWFNLPLSVLLLLAVVVTLPVAHLYGANKHSAKTASRPTSTSSKVSVSELSSSEINGMYESFTAQHPELHISLTAFATAAFTGTLSHAEGKMEYYTYNGVGHSTWGGRYQITINGRIYKFVCFMPLKPTKSPTTNAQVSNVYNYSNTGVYNGNTAIMAYLLDARGPQTTITTDQADALHYLVLMNTGDATTRYIAGLIKPQQSATAHGYDTSWQSDAVAHVGPYTPSMTLTSKPNVGNTGWTTFKLVSSRSGQLMANKPFQASISGPGVLTSTYSTTGNGVRGVSFKPTGFGTIKVCGTASSLAGTKVTHWWSVSGYQEFASAGSRTSVSACTSYVVSPVIPKRTSVCSVDCHGVATVTKTVCSYGVPAQYHTLDNGVLRSEFTSVAANAACTSYSLKVADRHTVQTQLWLYVNGTWVKTNLNDKFTVDCPAIIGAMLTLGCDCTGMTTSVTEGANTTLAVQKAVLTNAATGAVLLTITSNPGEAQKTMPVTGTAPGVMYVLSCSAQKMDGTWRTIVCAHGSEG